MFSLRSKPSKIKYFLVGLFLFVVIRTIHNLNLAENSTNVISIFISAFLTGKYRGKLDILAFTNDIALPTSLIIPLLIIIYYAQKYYQEKVHDKIYTKFIKIAFYGILITTIVNELLILSSGCDELDCVLVIIYPIIMIIYFLILLVISLVIAKVINVSYYKPTISKFIEKIPIIFKLLLSLLVLGYISYLALFLIDFCTFSKYGKFLGGGEYDTLCIAKQAVRENNPSLCEKAPSQYRDYCYRDLADITNNPSYCDLLYSTSVVNKEECIRGATNPLG